MKSQKYLNYEVYEDGTVYSYYINSFLSGEITKHGYLQYTLTDNNGSQFRIKAHRLVGMLFLNCPSNYEDLVINHKDGNKLNNRYSNLEWVTVRENNIHAIVNGLNKISESNTNRWKNESWANNTRRNMSISALSSGCNKGSNNGRFRYIIYDKYGYGYNRKELSSCLNISQSYTDSLIKKIADGKPINNKNAIDLGLYVIDVKKKSQSTIESID